MIRGFTLLVTVALLAPFGVNAEVITLEQAIERALQTDPRIEERQHLVAAAHALLQEALSLLIRTAGQLQINHFCSGLSLCQKSLRNDILDF